MTAIRSHREAGSSQMESRVESDPLESAITPEILQALIDERYRLEARLRRSNPDFRRLETVCRMIALYPPGAEVPTALDPISYPEPAGSEIRPAPTDAKGNGIGQNMLLGRTPTNSSSSPPMPPDPPTGSRRGSWWVTNSKASRMRAATAQYLEEIGRRAKGTEISKVLLSRGIEIGGRKPSSTLSAELTQSPMFDHIHGQGYGLREWSNDGEPQKEPIGGGNEHRRRD